jgi:hypothetical protein
LPGHTAVVDGQGLNLEPHLLPHLLDSLLTAHPGRPSSQTQTCICEVTYLLELIWNCKTHGRGVVTVTRRCAHWGKCEEKTGRAGPGDPSLSCERGPFGGLYCCLSLLFLVIFPGDSLVCGPPSSVLKCYLVSPAYKSTMCLMEKILLS